MQVVELVGGHAALDLVNTVAWRGDPGRRHDRLRTDDDVVTWAARTGVLTPSAAARLTAATPDRAVLGEVRVLREALHAVLLADVQDVDDVQGSEHRDTVHHAIAGAVALARPSRQRPWRWHIEDPGRTELPALAALQAADLLATSPAPRIRTCEDPACGWLFLDRTRNQSRRWCSSTDCGNRARNRRHAQRTRQSP